MTPPVHQSIEAMKQARQAMTGRVAFVPTMGALHEGHLSLVRKAKELADTVVMSIYVNPSQFAPHEDLDKYPRDLQGDIDKAVSAGVDEFFAPNNDMMYPEGFGCWVEPDWPMMRLLEGASRPRFFRGVATIVLKLFNIVQPNVAIFGLKDYQQFLVIERMTRELHLDIEIIGAPLIREADGLAMSSRNAYLTSEQRKHALLLNQILKETETALRQHPEQHPQRLCETMRERISQIPEGELDYFELVDPKELTPLETTQPTMLAVLAARVGQTRLIDNQLIELNH